MDAVHVPDAAIVAQLRRIDRGLSVEWLQTARGGRWAVLHAEQAEGFEQRADQVARQLWAILREDGYETPLHECQQRAYARLKDAQIVCYVVNDDGSYRPLDGRIVEKLQRMDYYRRNCGLSDWQTMLKVKDEALQKQREREAAQFDRDVAGDKVFAHCLSNLLWGVKTPMHYNVPRTGDDHATDIGSPGDRSGSGGAEALYDGGRGDPVPARDGDDSEGPGD